jgi:hypothetical protein
LPTDDVTWSNIIADRKAMVTRQQLLIEKLKTTRSQDEVRKAEVELVRMRGELDTLMARSASVRSRGVDPGS